MDGQVQSGQPFRVGRNKQGRWCLPGEGLSGDSKEVQANSPVVLEGNLIMIRAADPEWKNIVN